MLFGKILNSVTKMKNMFEEFTVSKFQFSSFNSKMTTGGHKTKAVAELASEEFDETSLAENSQPENLVAGPSKSLKIQVEIIVR